MDVLRAMRTGLPFAALAAFTLLLTACGAEPRCERTRTCVRYAPPPGMDGSVAADAGDDVDGGDATRDGGRVQRDGGVARDAGLRDGGSPDDCRVTGCGTNETCNQTTLVCECVPEAIVCADTCALCPTDPGVATTGCSGASCVATSCSTGFELCGATCCVVAMPTWRPELVTTNGGGSSLLLDASGDPTIAYASHSPRGVYYRTRAGAGWSAPETVDSRTNALEPVLVDSGGPVIVNSVSDLNAEQIAAWRRAGSWSLQASSMSVDRPDIAVGGGVDHLVGVHRVPGGTSTIRYFSRTSGTASWSAYQEIAFGVGWQVEIGASPSGTVYVLYPDTDQELWFARRTASTPFSSTRITIGPVWDFDVRVDGFGVAHVVYYLASTHQIRYETYSGTSRTRQVTVDTTGGSPPGSMHFNGLSIDVGPSGAHVSYLDFSRGPSTLRYAAEVTGWAPESVTAADDVLGGTSIAVDAADAPHVTFPYPAASFSSLGYAVKR